MERMLMDNQGVIKTKCHVSRRKHKSTCSRSLEKEEKLHEVEYQASYISKVVYVVTL